MSTPTSVSSIEQRAGVEKRGLVRSVRWNLSRAWIVTRRELVDMLRDWRITAPVLLLSLITPGLANWGAERLLAWIARYGATLVADRIAPFLLLAVGFFPASFSLIIALESFVGEKERRSLEPLLSSPLTDTQVYIGKTLAATMPPTIGSLLAMVVYVVGQSLAGSPMLAPSMLVQIALLNIMHALVMVAGAVIVSSQVTSVRAANLLASFIIVPIALLLQTEAFIMFWGHYGALWWMLVGLVVVYVVLVRMGVRSFNREDLLGGEIDEINLVQIAKQLWRLVLARREDGVQRSPWQWYRDEVLGAVTRTRPAMALVAVAMLAAFLIGRYYGTVFGVPPEAFVLDDWYARFHSLLIDTGLSFDWYIIGAGTECARTAHRDGAGGLLRRRAGRAHSDAADRRDRLRGCADGNRRDGPGRGAGGAGPSRPVRGSRCCAGGRAGCEARCERARAAAG